MGIDVITLALAKGYTDEKIDAALGDVPLDTSLTKNGQAADAKAVGDRIQSLSEEISDRVIAPTTAAVSQTIVVKAVNENSKPTEWETVDFPEQVQSDWEQNDDSCADFVKNRPFYEKIDSVTLMPETQFSNLTHIYNPEVSIASDVNGEYIVDFTEGKIFKDDPVKVTFNGTVYECVKKNQYIGNQSFMSYDGVEDTGEPFLFWLGAIPSFHTKSTDCVVKVEADISQIKKIDSKFLELPIAPGSGRNSTIENCTANYDSNIKNTANGQYSHAEGSSNSADGDYSHAEGQDNEAKGSCSHAEGSSNSAVGNYSHVEGYYNSAVGNYSHVEGKNTIAKGGCQHVQGRYNIEDPIILGKYAHIVGNGTEDDKRSNAHTLDWYGNAWYAGNIYVGSTSGTNQDGGSKKLATEEFVNEAVSGIDIPEVDLSSYQEKLTAGDNITIEGNVISATGGSSSDLSTELWTFQMADGSIITKEVYVK